MKFTWCVATLLCCIGSWTYTLMVLASPSSLATLHPSKETKDSSVLSSNETTVNITKPSNETTMNTTQSGNETTEQPTGYHCNVAWSGNDWMPNTMRSYIFEYRVSYKNVCRNAFTITETCIFFSIGCTTQKIYKEICTNRSSTRSVPQRRRLESLHNKYGFFKPISERENHYRNDRKLLWQLQAPEGSLVYLELSNIDLHMSGNNNCSKDRIEIRIDPCHEPEIICNNSMKVYSRATEARSVQIMFVTDSEGTATGFKGAYYYYPINSSNPFEDAQNRLRERKLNGSRASNASNPGSSSLGSRRRRRLASRQSSASGMVEASEFEKDETAPYKSNTDDEKTQPLVNQKTAPVYRQYSKDRKRSTVLDRRTVSQDSSILQRQRFLHSLRTSK